MKPLDVNPEYAHAHYPDRREDTVSLRDLTPEGHKSRHTSLSEDFPQDTSTDYDGTKTWSPFEDCEGKFSCGVSSG